MTDWGQDQIHIKNLEVFGNHSVFPEENKLGQKFLINVTAYLPIREAGLRDDLTATINYGEIARFVTKYMKEHTFRLIEAVAEQMARALLLEFPAINKVTLEVLKPWAPIGLPVETVSVEITRSWHQAYVAIGSNLGDRGEYIKKGIEALKQNKGCLVELESKIITTKPYGGVEQPDFLNGMIKLRTVLSPVELLEFLHEVEQLAHRERKIHWGPRTLDLDIIFYDDLVLDLEFLQIPHSDMHNRDFVLKPMAELAPCYRHPLNGKTVRQMLEELLERQKETKKGQV